MPKTHGKVQTRWNGLASRLAGRHFVDRSLGEREAPGRSRSRPRSLGCKESEQGHVRVCEYLCRR